MSSVPASKIVVDPPPPQFWAADIFNVFDGPCYLLGLLVLQTFEWSPTCLGVLSVCQLAAVNLRTDQIFQEFLPLC